MLRWEVEWRGGRRGRPPSIGIGACFGEAGINAPRVGGRFSVQGVNPLRMWTMLRDERRSLVTALAVKGSRVSGIHCLDKRHV